MAMKIKLCFLILPLLLLIHNKTFPQIQIEIVDNSEDMVGRRLVYHVKEKFRQSRAFQLVVAPEGPRFRLIIYTMDRFEGDRSFSNVSTMYSVVWLFYDDEKMLFPIYLDSTLGFAGSNVVESSAEGIVAQTDRIVTQIGELLKEIEKLLKPRK